MFYVQNASKTPQCPPILLLEMYTFYFYYFLNLRPGMSRFRGSALGLHSVLLFEWGCALDALCLLRRLQMGGCSSFDKRRESGTSLVLPFFLVRFTTPTCGK